MRKKRQEKDRQQDAVRAAQRVAMVRVLSNAVGGGCLVATGFVLSLWSGLLVLGITLLWLGGVLHAPRRPRADV